MSERHLKGKGPLTPIAPQGSSSRLGPDCPEREVMLPHFTEEEKEVQGGALMCPDHSGMLTAMAFQEGERQRFTFAGGGMEPHRGEDTGSGSPEESRS